MLTLFAVPKTFGGESGPLQRNALRSWLALDEVEVLLLGDDAGVAEAATEFGVRHIAGVATNDLGTPLLDSAFRLAEEHAREAIVGYANADLIIYPDLVDAVRMADERQRPFMLVGRCYDLPVSGELREDGIAALRGRQDGELRGPEWVDYFIFRRGSIGRLPPFAVGRPWWDRWMIWNARKLRLDLVDVSDTVRVIHQRHGYGHVKQSAGWRWRGPEGDTNRSFLRFEQELSIRDATHHLSDGQITRREIPFRNRVRIELWLHDWGIPIFNALHWVWWTGWARFRRSPPSALRGRTGSSHGSDRC